MPAAVWTIAMPATAEGDSDRATVRYQFGDDPRAPFGREDDITELRLSLTGAVVARA